MCKEECLLKKFLSIVLCVLWITFIFSNSSVDGGKSYSISTKFLNNIKVQLKYYKNKIKMNNKNSSKDSEPMNSLVMLASSKSPNIRGNNAFQSYLTRKSAHLFEYFILALLICNSFKQFKVDNSKGLIYILFICLCTAHLDEFYQSFIPERTSSVRDILLDFTGSLIGILFSYLTFYGNYRRSRRG